MEYTAPKERQNYYFIGIAEGHAMIFRKTNNGSHKDMHLIAMGNFFKTFEEAEQNMAGYVEYLKSRVDSPDTSWRK